MHNVLDGPEKMKRKKWKDLLEALGIVAIVASLILVAYELRQNTLMMRAQINQSRTEVAVSEQQARYNSDYMPGIINKVRSAEQLKAEERIRYESYLRGFLRNQDNAYWQYQQGLLGENIPRSIRYAVRGVVGRNSQSREIWDDQKVQYTAEFAEFVDESIADLRDE